MTTKNETTETTELANVVEPGTVDLADDIERMEQGHVGVFSSYKGADHDTKIKVLSAMSNATPFEENLGKTINLENYVVQSVEMPDEDTGELRTVPRIILVDNEGNSFYAISTGLWSSLKNLCGILGLPSTWEKPVKVEFVQEKTRSGYRVFSLKIKG